MANVVIAPQTKIAFVGYVLIVISKMIYMISNGKETIKSYFPITLLFIVISALGLYVLNCTVVGSCFVYAWIMSYFVAIAGLFMLTWLIFKLI